jgi:glycosyltransferase involved in cell wall biosynthesis
LQTLSISGGITENLKHHPWKWTLLPLFFLSMGIKLVRVVWKIKPALIHAHWIIPQGLVASALRFVCRRPPPPLIISVHGGDLYGLQGRFFFHLKRFALKRATGVLVVSQAMMSEVVSIGADQKTVRHIPMGIDFNHQFLIRSDVARVPFEILFVGRLVEKKGVKYLIQALPHVLRHFPKAYLTIAGDGPESDNLRNMVSTLNICDRVNFLGSIPNNHLAEHYRRATVFVAPFVQAETGDMDGLGLVTIEAIACGCPVIVCDLPSTADIFSNAYHDQRVRQKDPLDLAEKIVHVLSNPEEFRTRSQTLRESLIQRYDWSRITQRHADYIRECINDAHLAGSETDR